MTALAVFGATLLLAVLLSGWAQRSVLSTALLFLSVGLACGPDSLHLIPAQPSAESVSRLANVALFSVLFSDGMKASAPELARAWRLPGRALLFGMPLTMLLIASFAWMLAGLPWLDALLVGAVLAPTDPVFASAIVGRDDVPQRLRHLLNVESGVNDGLALPAVVVLLALLGASDQTLPRLAEEVAGGAMIGALIALAAAWLVRLRWLGPSPAYEPVFGVAVGLLVYAAAASLHFNEYLAGFSAGVTMATAAPQLREEFSRFGEVLNELLKLGALLLFGALITFDGLVRVGWTGLGFAILVIAVARPLALLVSLWRSGLPWGERLTAAWFGPKGFASVVFGILVLQSLGAAGQPLFDLVAIAVAVSICAHSSTDVLVARWLRRADQRRAATAASQSFS